MSIEERLARRIRFLRNRLLVETDWTQLGDVPMTTEKKQEWTNYRQQLRDITVSEGFPANVTFPTKPS